ncbi:MAG: hypothetical protein IKP37_05165 [Paludibacteraceae bacterium]|nr:hypothetical protein [Paludibacteraceae bacterium]
MAVQRKVVNGLSGWGEQRRCLLLGFPSGGFACVLGRLPRRCLWLGGCWWLGVCLGFDYLRADAVDAPPVFGLRLEGGLQIWVAGGKLAVHLHVLHAPELHYVAALGSGNRHDQGVEPGKGIGY